MRMIKKLYILCFFLVLIATGCETYDDYEISYSPVYPLSGEWIVRFTNTTAGTTSGLFVLSTYNTADNSTDQMWIRATSTSTNSSYTGRFTGKINCDVTGRSFDGENAVNTYYTNGTIFTITDGTVEKDGYDTATGHKADRITFTMTDSRKSGIVFTVTGFRRTRWIEDEQ